MAERNKLFPRRSGERSVSSTKAALDLKRTLDAASWKGEGVEVTILQATPNTRSPGSFVFSARSTTESPNRGKKPKLTGYKDGPHGFLHIATIGAEKAQNDLASDAQQAGLPIDVYVFRDPGKPDGPFLFFSKKEIDAFVAGARDGEFDI